MGSYTTVDSWQQAWDEDPDEVLLRWTDVEATMKRQALLRLSNHIAADLEAHPDETVNKTLETLWNDPPAPLPNVMLQAIEHYCSHKFNPKFTQPYESLALHAFAELCDCPWLLGWSIVAFESEWREMCPGKPDDDFFAALAIEYRPFITGRLPRTSELVRSNITAECLHRLIQLRETGQHETAWRYMMDVPWATADMFRHVASDMLLCEKEYEWRCDGCGAEFVYTRSPKRADYRLPSCPCCVVSGDVLRTVRIPTSPTKIQEAKRADQRD